MRFFVLEKLLEGPHDAEFSSSSDNVGTGLHCPQCAGPIGSLSWEPPYQGELELYGKDFGDLVEGPGGVLLVTERFAEAFKAEGLTGRSGFHPVEVLGVIRKRRGPKPGPPPRYLLVTPIYGSPALDLERSRSPRGNSTTPSPSASRRNWIGIPHFKVITPRGIRAS